MRLMNWTSRSETRASDSVREPRLRAARGAGCALTQLRKPSRHSLTCQAVSQDGAANRDVSVRAAALAREAEAPLASSNGNGKHRNDNRGPRGPPCARPARQPGGIRGADGSMAADALGARRFPRQRPPARRAGAGSANPAALSVRRCAPESARAVSGDPDRAWRRGQGPRAPGGGRLVDHSHRAGKWRGAAPACPCTCRALAMRTQVAGCALDAAARPPRSPSPVRWRGALFVGARLTDRAGGPTTPTRPPFSGCTRRRPPTPSRTRRS